MALHVGILQFELLIDGAESLKDRRRVVRSVKDRLHREHMVSVAELPPLENAGLAVLGLACVSADVRRVSQTIDRVVAKLHGLTDARLGDMRRDVISGDDSETVGTESGMENG